MNPQYEIECPYCGIKFKCALSVHPFKTIEVAYCDVENYHGCGRMFVVESVFEPKFITRKIVGEE